METVQAQRIMSAAENYAGACVTWANVINEFAQYGQTLETSLGYVDLTAEHSYKVQPAPGREIREWVRDITEAHTHVVHTLTRLRDVVDGVETEADPAGVLAGLMPRALSPYPNATADIPPADLPPLKADE